MFWRLMAQFETNRGVAGRRRVWRPAGRRGAGTPEHEAPGDMVTGIRRFENTDEVTQEESSVGGVPEFCRGRGRGCGEDAEADGERICVWDERPAGRLSANV